MVSPCVHLHAAEHCDALGLAALRRSKDEAPHEVAEALRVKVSVKVIEHRLSVPSLGRPALAPPPWGLPLDRGACQCIGARMPFTVA